jgi:hypothetical protein
MYTREGNSPLKAGARVRLPYAMPGPHDFGFLGTARAFKSDSITEGRISTKAPESAQNATCVNLDQQGINKTKGGKDEKTSFDCIGGNWVTFCARTAFRRSDYGWRWGSRNRIWLSRLPIRLLSIRLRLLSIWILPTVSVLQPLLWAVILLV